MKPFRKLGDATAPDGTVMTLYEHDGAYVIRINGVELMSTRRHLSEDALADLVCEPLRAQRNVRVLVGGLGLGFTLRAALATLPSDAHVVVAELVDTVIAWNRNPDYPFAAAALQDPRVELRHADVARVLREQRRAFDAIMLDVDNGADPLTTAGNARLYRSAGIHFAVDALRPGGRLAYWSSTEDPGFEAALRGAGLRVTVHRVRVHPTSRVSHWIFVGEADG